MNEDLVIAFLNLEEALWVVANRANSRCLLAYNDVTTVAALPNAIAIT
jgi:hypothetical protein